MDGVGGERRVGPRSLPGRDPARTFGEGDDEVAILHRYPTVAFALLLVLPILGHAQEQGPRTAPEKGDWSISLGLFEVDNGINFGAYRLFSDRVKLGLEVEVSYAGADSDQF